VRLLSRTLAPGDFYADRRVTGFLGRGGMGSVYRVEHPRLVPRQRALKVLDPGIWLPPRWEVEVERRLGAHPNVVRTLSAGHDARTSTYFHEMELLEGDTLEQHVRSSAPASPARALELLAGAAAALDAAHAHGLVHCDLKPANLMIVAPGPRLKVLDFGIAQALDERRTSERAGTLPYMAPEQIQGAPVSPMTDLWALALVAHFLLTRTRLWRTRDGAALRAEISGGAALALAAGASAWPREVDSHYRAWLLRALEPVPEARFASASELLLALSAALDEAAWDQTRPWTTSGAAVATPVATVARTTRVRAVPPARASEPSPLGPDAATPPAQDGSPPLASAEARALLVMAFFPRANDLVRVADDLSTTSIHYLLRPPSDQARLERQLRWFSAGVQAYNEARAAYERERPAFARMIESLFGGIEDTSHAALREASRCIGEFELEYPLPRSDPGADVSAQHAALCVRWQRARMSLASSLRQARRALDKLEQDIEQAAQRGSFALPRDPAAGSSAAALLVRYAEHAHALADNIAERFLTADFQQPSRVTERLWEMAPHIAALNHAFTELGNASLGLRISLLAGSGPEWRSEHKLASALARVDEFQWEICGPELNGVLVAVIGLLLGEPDEAWLAPVRAQRREWEHIVELLRSVQAPRALDVSQTAD
jgi:serine/threonine protein kinase